MLNFYTIEMTFRTEVLEKQTDNIGYQSVNQSGPFGPLNMILTT